MLCCIGGSFNIGTYVVMSIRIMNDQVREITRSQAVSYSLMVTADFFLVTLSYLRGECTLKHYQAIFEEACSLLAKESDCSRVIPVMDSLLVAVFYYKQAVTCRPWLYKKRKTLFNLSFMDSYERLVGLYSQDMGERVSCRLESERLLEELLLSGGRHTFSNAEVWNETGWMFQQLKGHDLITFESHLKSVLVRNKQRLFMNRYPIVKVLSRLGMVASVAMGLTLVIIVVRVIYNISVEFPLLWLMSMENAGKSYNNKVVEVLLECHSFLENGMDVLRGRILFFLIALFWTIGIDCVAEKLGGRLYL